jgi:DNA-binding PadR family transcriptional regulator
MQFALTPREVEVVELVGRFRLMTAGHIRELVFEAQASSTPLDRTLKRLTDNGYLVRLGRMVGGYGGGSGQYVYQLGRKGWQFLRKGGGYRPLRIVDQHTLAIADCFVDLKRLERGGDFAVIQYTPEPASHRTVGTTLLTPDAYIELGGFSQRRKLLFWLEVDRGTENADTIRGKCSRYRRAFLAWSGDTFPLVVFAVPDAIRQTELTRIVAGGPADIQDVFRVYLLGEVAEQLREDMYR